MSKIFYALTYRDFSIFYLNKLFTVVYKYIFHYFSLSGLSVYNSTQLASLLRSLRRIHSTQAIDVIATQALADGHMCCQYPRCSETSSSQVDVQSLLALEMLN